MVRAIRTEMQIRTLREKNNELVQIAAKKHANVLLQVTTTVALRYDGTNVDLSHLYRSVPRCIQPSST